MDWTEYSKQIIEKCKVRRIPASATFELTPLCNFNCNMCYIHLSPEQAKMQGILLSTDQWLHFAEETKRLGTLGIEVTGGEAIIRPDFPILYEKFIKMGFITSIRSNGYCIHDGIFKLLKQYKPRCVSITLYGASNETYQKICGVSDGFSKVTNNILALRDAGINVRLTSTMTKDNTDDRAKIIEWAKSNGFFISFYGGLINPIRMANRSIEHLKVDPHVNLVNTDYDIDLRVIQERDKYDSPFWMCRDYGARYCISWDGRMTLCNCLPSIWSDPLSLGICRAYKTLYEQLDNLRRPFECYNCQFIDFCGACPSRLFSETGSNEETCKSICDIAKQKYFFSLSNVSKYANRKTKTLFSDYNERNSLNED